jgi:hypothetical protein
MKKLLEEAGIDFQRDNVRIVARPRHTSQNWAWDGVDAIEQGVADGYWGNGLRADLGVKRGIAKILLDVRRGDGPPTARHWTFPALITTERLVKEQPAIAAGAVRAVSRRGGESHCLRGGAGCVLLRRERHRGDDRPREPVRARDGRPRRRRPVRRARRDPVRPSVAGIGRAVHRGGMMIPDLRLAAVTFVALVVAGTALAQEKLPPLRTGEIGVEVE